MQKIFLVVGFCAMVALCASLDGTHNTVADQVAASAGTGAEVALTKDTAHGLTAWIRQAGYDCPLVKTAYDAGWNARGTVLQVWCGPLGRDGVFPELHFRVTQLNDNRLLVKPWNE